MITRYKYERVEWVDLLSPNESDIEAIVREFNLDPTVAVELRSPTGRTKLESHPSYTYTVLHFPGPNDRNQELDFILGKNFLITTHYENVNPLFEFSKTFESFMLRGQMESKLHAGYLFYALILHMYRTVEESANYLTEDIEKAERAIFAGKERIMVEELSHLLGRELDIRMAMKPHLEIWSFFEPDGVRIFGGSYAPLVTTIQAAHQKILNVLEGNKEAIGALRETNDSLLTAKTNETLVHLSMMAFVVFPLTLIAGIFGMNTQFLPFIGHPFDFWIVLGIMALAAAAIFSFFKYRKWL